MPGTKEGGKKADHALSARLGGEEAAHAWRVETGRLGGQKSRGGGFASDVVGRDGLTGKQRAQVAGIKGGKTSRKKR